jgi:hypothetical protein
MEPEGSLPHSQVPATDPVHTPASYVLKIHLNIILPFITGPSKYVCVTTARFVLLLRMEERPTIWRVAANILNKQSRTKTRGNPPAGVGWMR